jgi:putative endonuclease
MTPVADISRRLSTEPSARRDATRLPDARCPHAERPICGRLPTPARWRAEVVGVNAKDVLGQQGEQVAARFLTEAGLAVLGRNWRCSQGEIDIIALDGRTLVICEVKTRSGVRYGTPLEAISKPKLRRLRRLAVTWVRAHGLVFDQIRIDVVGVLRAASGEFSVEHVRGVG